MEQKEFEINEDGVLLSYHGTKNDYIEVPEGVICINSDVFREVVCINIQLPSTLQRIEHSAFERSFIVWIKIPSSVTYLGESFYFCQNLETVYFEEGSELEKICGFWCCTALKEVVLPDKLEVIGSHCFVGCSALKKIDLPPSLKKIDSFGFATCSSLGQIHLPDQLKQIKSVAFLECTSLSTVTIPDSVEEVHHTAFKDCHPYLKVEGWTFPEIEETEEQEQ